MPGEVVLEDHRCRGGFPVFECVLQIDGLNFLFFVL